MQHEQMEKLARTFPSLEAARGVKPWEPKELAEWACGFERGTIEHTTALFLLWVYDPFTLWSCGRFDLLAALATWDEPHREAFAAWVRSPWWA